MTTQARERGKQLKAMADAEADRAEAENPDEPDEDADAEPDENEDAEAAEDDEQPEASLEASLKAFEREHERHRLELQAIMGDDFAAFAECPGCTGLGYQALEGPQYDPQLERCETCKGHTFLLTHAVEPNHATRPCTDCGGNGFKVKVMPPAQVATQPAGQPVPMFDPYTGQPLSQAGPNGQTDVTWAPGFVPPPGPAPSPVPGP